MLRISNKVSLNALVRRINRKLVADDERLCKSRGFRDQLEFGDFYLANTRFNAIMRGNVDPEELGRELDVLKDFERVEASDAGA